MLAGTIWNASERGRGFTLVELLLAATVMSVLFVGLGSHLRGGVAVWQRTTQTAERLQRQRVAWERLERDLAQALIFDARAEAYGDSPQLPAPAFGETTLAFFTVAPSEPRQPPAIRFVTYACQAHAGAAGLWRTSQSIGQARARSPEPTRELLLPGCEALALRYAYRPPAESASQELVWQPAWPDRPNEPWRLPRLVEVSLRVGGGDIRRTGSVPAGALGQSASPTL